MTWSRMLILAASHGSDGSAKHMGKAIPSIGTRSMLEHTFSRAEQLIPQERIVTVMARDHLKYLEVQRQISERPPRTIVLQPMNIETGPGLLLPLMHLTAPA